MNSKKGQKKAAISRIPQRGTETRRTTQDGEPLASGKASPEMHAARKPEGKEKPASMDKPKAASGTSVKRQTKPVAIEKKTARSGSIREVTFRLPGQAAGGARTVTVVGDFNDWDKQSNPLRRLENGDFVTTIKLDAGKEYRFRYLIDGKRWENDWHADKYVKSPYGVEDSVVCT